MRGPGQPRLASRRAGPAGTVAEPALVVADWAHRPELATLPGAAIMRSAALSSTPVREETPHPGLGYQSSRSAAQARVILVERPGACRRRRCWRASSMRHAVSGPVNASWLPGLSELA